MALLPPLRIFLIEDEPLWQEALPLLLSTEPAFQVVGVEDNAESALNTIETLQPDIVISDFNIAGELTGLDLANTLVSKGLWPERFILISGADTAIIPPHSFCFIPKTTLADCLIPQLHQLHQTLGVALPS